MQAIGHNWTAITGFLCYETDKQGVGKGRAGFTKQLPNYCYLTLYISRLNLFSSCIKIQLHEAPAGLFPGMGNIITAFHLT
jgi:hypothetical protein